MALQDLLDQNATPDYDELGLILEEELGEAFMAIDAATLAEMLRRYDSGIPDYEANCGVEVEDRASGKKYVVRITLTPEVRK